MSTIECTNVDKTSMSSGRGECKDNEFLWLDTDRYVRGMFSSCILVRVARTDAEMKRNREMMASEEIHRGLRVI